jgi:homospermidine synthase
MSNVACCDRLHEGSTSMKYVSFTGRLVMLGCGSIGQGVLPLILRHIDIPTERIHILSADARGNDVAAKYGMTFTVAPLTQDNYRDLLAPLLSAGDFLLNLSVDLSSVALITLCQELGALYLDTCIEPWVGGYTDPSLTPSQRSNYGLRERTGAGQTRAQGPHRRADAWSQSGAGLAFRQASAAQSCARHRCRPGGAGIARGLGGAIGDPWRKGDPHRRARHAIR